MEFNHLTPKDENSSPHYQPQPIQKRELEIDLTAAAKIEEESWLITQKLTQDYQDDFSESITVGADEERLETNYKDELKKVERPLMKASENEFWEFAAQLSPEEDHFVSLSLHFGKETARKFAISLGAFFEAMVANCNEKAVESIGDAVMEPNGQIFDEYRNDLSEVFPEPKGEAQCKIQIK